jgi:hypothetical protein
MEEIDQFLDEFNGFPSLWNSIDVRGVALHIDGEWHNALTVCRLRSQVANEGSLIPNLPETSLLKCWHEILPIFEIDRILSGLRDGGILWGSLAVKYLAAKGSSAPESYRTHLTFQRVGSPPNPWSDRAWAPASPLRWPESLLRASGGDFSDLLRHIRQSYRDLTNEVHALPVPFDGFEGIARHIVGMRPHNSLGDWPDILPNYTTYFYMSVPFEARFALEGTRLHGGALEICVQVGSQTVAEHTSIGCVLERDGELLQAESIHFGDDSTHWDVHSCTLNVKVTRPGATLAVLLLRVGNRPIERLHLADFNRPARNSRAVAYLSVDPGFDLLSSALEPNDRSDGSGFERAVARLFGLLGFQTLGLANDKKLSEAVDVLAFNPYGEHVFAIECTTGSLDSGGKLGKLYLRMMDLSNQLKEHRVQGILATASERHALSSVEIEKAAQDRIAVLTSGDLKDLLRMASEGGAISSVLSYIGGKIPKPSRTGNPLRGSLGGIRVR